MLCSEHREVNLQLPGHMSLGHCETFPSQGLLNTVNWERMLCESLGIEELEFKIKIEKKKINIH